MWIIDDYDNIRYNMAFDFFFCCCWFLFKNMFHFESRKNSTLLDLNSTLAVLPKIYQTWSCPEPRMRRQHTVWSVLLIVWSQRKRVVCWNFCGFGRLGQFPVSSFGYFCPNTLQHGRCSSICLRRSGHSEAWHNFFALLFGLDLPLRRRFLSFFKNKEFHSPS